MTNILGTIKKIDILVNSVFILTFLKVEQHCMVRGDTDFYKKNIENIHLL